MLNLGSQVDDDVLPGVVQTLLVAGRPGIDDAVPAADVHRAVLHHPLERTRHLRLVQRMDLHPRPAAGVQASQEVPGNVFWRRTWR